MHCETWVQWSAMPLRRSQQWVRVTSLALVASPLLGAYWSSGQQSSTLPIGIIPCPFRALTGIPCPGCGMARALGAIAQGNFTLALQYHAFSPCVVLLCGAIMTVILLELKAGRALESPAWQKIRARSGWFPIWLALTLLAYHLTRLWLIDTREF